MGVQEQRSCDSEARTIEVEVVSLFLHLAFVWTVRKDPTSSRCVVARGVFET